MSNNKQSSVDWVIDEIIKHQMTFYGTSSIPLRIIEKAKAMHKSEIIWAHGIKMKGVNNHKCVSGEQYYNETFSK
jgi:hypothetical protein